MAVTEKTITISSIDDIDKDYFNGVPLPGIGIDASEIHQLTYNSESSNANCTVNLPYIMPQGYSISGTNWSQSAVGGIYSNTAMEVNQSGKISVKGENADIDINGKSLVQWMQVMEERMNWMQPNVELEKEWDDLKKLGDRYRKLEKKCREKAEMWKKLKSMPKPEIK